MNTPDDNRVTILQTARIAVIALLMLGAYLCHAEASIEGVWLNGDGDGWIEIAIVDGELRGTIVGSPDDPDRLQPSRLDELNPDPALRGRELFGLEILQGFRQTDEDAWKGGTIYDPNSGNTYKGTITVVDADTLKLRGFVGMPLFGRTEIWTRRIGP